MSPIAEAWQQLCEREREFIYARRRFFAYGDERLPVLRRALSSPQERGTALRVLLLMDESAHMSLFASLLNACTVAHSDIALAREVLMSISRAWTRQRVDEALAPLLADAGAEEFRRLAELLEALEFHEPLAELVARAAAHSDPDVREVGDDYTTPPDP